MRWCSEGSATLGVTTGVAGRSVGERQVVSAERRNSENDRSSHAAGAVLVRTVGTCGAVTVGAGADGEQATRLEPVSRHPP
jgi:hypothetical protein